MLNTTTGLLNFYENLKSTQTKIIVNSFLFGKIRKNLVDLIMFLSHDGFENNEEMILMIRYELVKLLFTPIEPDEELILRCNLNDYEKIKRKYGHDFFNKILSLEENINLYKENESILRKSIIDEYVNAINHNGHDLVKIYCHLKGKNAEILT